MSDSLTFPQHGDARDAAFFAFLSGIGTQTSAIVNGLSVTADDSNLTIDVDRGKAVVVRASKDTASNRIQPNKTLDIAAHGIQFAGQTDISISDNTVNEIYLNPQFNEVNDPRIVVNPTTTDTLLKIASVDTTGTGTGTGTGITVRDQWFLLSESGILSFPDNAALMDSMGSLSPSTLVRDRATDTLSVTTPSGLHEIPSASEIDATYAEQSYVNSTFAEQSSVNSTFADIGSGGTEIPVYQTLGDVPSTLETGDVIYVDSEGKLFVNTPSELVSVGVNRNRVSESIESINRLFIDNARQDFELGLNILEMENGQFEIYADDTDIVSTNNVALNLGNVLNGNGTVTLQSNTTSGFTEHTAEDYNLLPASVLITDDVDTNPQNGTIKYEIEDENGNIVTIPRSQLNQQVDVSNTIETYAISTRAVLERNSTTDTAPVLDAYSVYVSGQKPNDYLDAQVTGVTEV